MAEDSDELPLETALAPLREAFDRLAARLREVLDAGPHRPADKPPQNSSEWPAAGTATATEERKILQELERQTRLLTEQSRLLTEIRERLQGSVLRFETA